MQKFYRIYSSRIAGLLRQRGFKILGVEPNLKKPQYDVFLFEDTEELRKNLTALSK